MKEWENWWDRNENYYNAIRCATEDGWRAALEWALSLNSVRVHDDVYEDIKKELEDD